MRALRLPLIIVILCSFAFGLFWGLKLKRERQARAGQLQSAVSVKVLAFKNLIPASTLRRFEIERSIKINLVEATTPDELMSLWTHAPSNDDFDLVTVLSAQLKPLLAAQKIQRFNLRQVPASSNASRDFIDWPDASGASVGLPLAWGIMKSGDAKGVLWVIDVVVGIRSVEAEAAHSFVDFLFEQQSALEMVKSSGLASTNKTVEAIDLKAELKPSYLRQIPLTDFTMMSDDPKLRTALGERFSSALKTD